MAETFWSRPEALVTSNRLDVFIRYLYAVSTIHGSKAQKARAQILFESHVLLLNPSNKWGENGTKFSPNDYTREFDLLIADMVANGYVGEPIPICSDGSIVNGAHRLAAALALGIPVKCRRVSSIPQDYSKQKLTKLGFPPWQVAWLELLSIRVIASSRALVLFGGKASEIQKVEASLAQELNVLDKMEVPAGIVSSRNIIRVAYGLNSWFTEGELERLFVERFPLRHRRLNTTVWFVRSRSVNDPDIRPVKETIRKSMSELAGFERRLHGTDNLPETLFLATLAFTQSGRLILDSEAKTRDLLDQMKKLDTSRSSKFSLRLIELFSASDGIASRQAKELWVLGLSVPELPDRNWRPLRYLDDSIWPVARRLAWRSRVSTSRRVEKVLSSTLTPIQRERLSQFLSKLRGSS